MASWFDKNEKAKSLSQPAFTKVPGYKQLQSIINPYSGFDFDAMRAELMKLKEASDKDQFDAALQKLKDEWFEKHYRLLTLQEKMDMAADDFIALFHANIDKVVTKEFPAHAVSLYQSLEKSQNERARLCIEYMRLQLARDMFTAQQDSNAKNHAQGYIDVPVQDEDGNDSDGV